MSFKKFLLHYMLLVALLLPVTTFAANATFFGPIVPEECKCNDQANPNGGTITTAPDYGCVLQVVQNVINFAISIGILLTVFYIALGGVTLILNPTNASKRTQAKNRVLNGVIGIVVIMSAWLIVDFVMKTLYDDNAGFGPWNAILADTGNHKCIVAKNPASIVTVVTGTAVVINNTPPTYGGGTSTGGNCTEIPDSQLVTVDGYKLTSDTANRFNAMKNAAAQNGVTLVITSGYRSPSAQLSAWNANGCQLVNGRAVCSVRTAAVPCSLGGGGSNHTRGTAVDIRLNTGVYAWLTQNASRFGFFNNLSNDLPHWSDTGR